MPQPDSDTGETDFARTFQIEGLNVRGRLVRLGPALEKVIAGHDYPPQVRRLMGEIAVLAVILASALKYDGVFALQTQSDGPLSMMVADVTSEGALRGYARFDGAATLAAGHSGSATVPRLMGSGYMAFSVDQGPHSERYQGITELDGATLAECAHHYFRNSEQLETAIFLTADPGTGAAGAMAGALMVQRMPVQDRADPTPDDEDGWRRAVALLASLSREELLDSTLGAEALLYRLYHEDGVRVFEPRALYHHCRCSREKVAMTLKSFALEAVADDDGSAHITCEFCKAEHHFTPDQLAGLFAQVEA